MNASVPKSEREKIGRIARRLLTTLDAIGTDEGVTSQEMLRALAVAMGSLDDADKAFFLATYNCAQQEMSGNEPLLN